jgi:serine/threonine protein kinase
LNFTIPEPAINIIEKCLDKNPLKRYATATDLYEDFKKISS